MVEFRTFHNTDPPRLLRLWHTSGLGPSAAEGFPCEVLELHVFSRPWFDRKGMILAVSGNDVLGMIHAGFSANEQENGLDHRRGILSAIIVKPEHRRQGIGRQLVERAEGYLTELGAEVITAGAGFNGNGFYHGIYGGVEPCGFAESASSWTEFFGACGYEPGPVTLIFHRDLDKGRDPVNARLIRNRRRLQMVITDRISDQSWWWNARLGHQDTLRFQLNERGSGTTVATGHILGLDIYIPKWGVRAVGIRDVFVPEKARRQGFGFSLILEMCRQLREQSIRVVEAQVDSENSAAIDLFRSAKFDVVENLVTFRRRVGA